MLFYADRAKEGITEMSRIESHVLPITTRRLLLALGCHIKHVVRTRVNAHSKLRETLITITAGSDLEVERAIDAILARAQRVLYFRTLLCQENYGLRDHQYALRDHQCGCRGGNRFVKGGVQKID